LALAGANLVLNGFGDPDRIAATRRKLAAASFGEGVYDGADMTRPGEYFLRYRWDMIIDINMNSAFHTACAAVPGMKKKG